jgi:hypothetical protein
MADSEVSGMITLALALRMRSSRTSLVVASFD